MCDNFPSPYVHLITQVSHHRQQPQHQYKEGLSEFFTAGLTGEEIHESREQMNKSPTRSSVTPTNELPECSFQGKAGDEIQVYPTSPS